jgi:hypothetical protein
MVGIYRQTKAEEPKTEDAETTHTVKRGKRGTLSTIPLIVNLACLRSL